MRTICDSDGSWKILVVGNNPIELSDIFDRLKGIQHKLILTEMAFDLKSILERLSHFRPEHILIDDNIGRVALQTMIGTLHHHKTRNVPITILKNSNYQETIGFGVMNFILKQHLTSEMLYRELVNSNHFLETQRSWKKEYGKRKGQLERFFSSSKVQI